MIQVRVGLVALLCLVSGRTAHGKSEDTPDFFDGSDGPVVVWTRKTFISSVLESRTPAVAWFYSHKECPTCGEIAEIYEKAAHKMTSWGLKIGAVNVDTEAKLAKEMSVPKFPPMMNVYSGQSTPNPYGGPPVRSYQQLPVVKDPRSLLKQILTLLPDHVIPVDLRESSAPLKEALSTGERPYTAVLLSPSKKSSPFLRVLGSELLDEIDAIECHLPDIDDEDGHDGEGEDSFSIDTEQKKKDRVTRFLRDVANIRSEVSSFPALVLIDKKAEKSTLFDGDASSAKAMSEFIHGNMMVSRSDASKESPIDEGAVPWGGVLMLDLDRLETLEKKGVEALVIAFVDTSEGEKDVETFVPGWGNATKGLQGQIRACVFDCGDYPSDSRCKSKKAPHIKVYPHVQGLQGESRLVPSILLASQIKEAVAEAESFLPEVITVIPGGASAQQTEEVMNEVVTSSILAEGLPMVLIVLSRRDEPSLVVKTVATQFHPAGVKTLFISQPDPQVTASLQVPKLPAMTVMFQAPEDSSLLDGRPTNPTEKAMMTSVYSAAHWGPPTHISVCEFVISHLSHVSQGMFFVALNAMSATAELNGEALPSKILHAIAEAGKSEEGESSMSSSGNEETGTTSERPRTPFTGVLEATAEDWTSLNSASSTGAGMGVARVIGVFFLDRYAENFESALKTAESAAKSVHDTAESGTEFVWVDALCQELFSTSLGISDLSAVPALAVFSPKSQKFARFVGAWESDPMSTFLKKSIRGRAAMFPVNSEPRLEDVDCSQRPGPERRMGVDDVHDGDDDMSDFMAEILAEEAMAKKEREEAVARELKEMKKAEKAAAAESLKPKKKKKKRVKKKKKKGAAGGTSEEL